MSSSRVALLLAALLVANLLAACAPTIVDVADRPPVDEVLAGRPAVLWVAAHPDDESMAGPLLARACVFHRSACHFLVFSRGEGGECGRDDGCPPDLGTVRQGEMRQAAEAYGATLEHHAFSNSSLPVESFPTRPALEARWRGEGDPIGLVARAIREHRARVLVTFGPVHGFTGHPEHQAVARFAVAGARLAADPEADPDRLGGHEPHRPLVVYQVLNHHWPMRLAGASDPDPATETFDGDLPCVTKDEGEEISCVDWMAEATRVHASQDADMSTIRSFTWLLDTTYVRALDPLGDEAAALVRDLGPDPDQP